MVFTPSDKLKNKMTIDGSVLKYMHSVSGAGKGLWAGGIVLAAAGFLLAVLLVGTLELPKALLFGAIFLAPGVLMIVLGISMQKRRMNNYLSSIAKRMEMSEEELRQVEREFLEPGTVLLSFDKKKDKNSLKKMGFLTAHYVKMPGNNLVFQYIQPIRDIVACFYTDKFLCNDGGYDKVMMIYSTQMACRWDEPNPKAAAEIIQAIEARNPMVITTHHFTYEGKQYDAVRGAEEVVALNKRLREEQGV